jgi:catechol 2,3-dioxygenase-like lactoylglutathione lyase family enzyme
VQHAVADVQELRLVLTVPDFNAAVKLFRDALGLEELEAWEGEEEGARIVILDAGRATLELVNEGQAPSRLRSR